MLYDTKKKRGIEVNLVPLINVVFLLLIFFLVAGTFSQIENYAEIDEPLSKTGEQKQIAEIIITITKNDDIFLNDNKTSFLFLDSALKKYLKENPNGEIILRVDKETPSQKIIMLMRNISLYGGANISIATES